MNDVDVKHEEDTPADLGKEQQELEERAKSFLAKQTRPVIIPSYAAWFDINEIHEIEKRSLPEFFVSNPNSRFKNAKIYRDFRDFMIHTYRLNPVEYLTATAVRRNLAGDVASILRVFGFLQKWGLINYQVDPRTKSCLIGPQYTGHFQVTLDTPTGFAPLVKEGEKCEGQRTEVEHAEVKNVEEKKVEEKKVEEKNMEENGDLSEGASPNEPETPIPYNLEVRKNVYDSTADAFALKDEPKVANQRIGLKQFFCNTCGNDTTETRFHNLRSKSNICSRCFDQGSFPANFQSSDFVRLGKVVATCDNRNWSNEELLLLLEGVEMFDNDWDQVCSHVGSRTKDQCISKFVQLPIEDRFIHRNISREVYEKRTSNEPAPKIDIAEIVNKTISHLVEKIEPETAEKLVQGNISDETISQAAKIAMGSLIGNAYTHQDSSKTAQADLLKQAVDLQMEKIDAKLNQLSLVEKTLDLEKTAIAKQKHDIMLDRLGLRLQAAKVHQKLLDAARLGPTEEGLQLCNEAVVEAGSSPRMFVVKKSSVGIVEAVGDKLAKGDSENILKEDLEPVSVQSPKAFQVWSM